MQKNNKKNSGERSTTITDQKFDGKAKVPSFKKTPTSPEENRQRAGSKKTLSFSEENRERGGSKKTLTFSEENQSRRGSKRFNQAKEQEIQPAPSWDRLGPRSTILGPQPGETKADAWEREQLQKIRDRYSQLLIHVMKNQKC